MARRYRKYQEEYNDFGGFIGGVIILYFLYLFFQYFSDRENFWRWLLYGLIFIVFVIVFLILLKKWEKNRRQQKIKRTIDLIERAGLAESINNFITRFGLGQEKSRNVWRYENYVIDWHRIRYLKDDFANKGIKLSDLEMKIVLSHYINKREYDFTSKSIEVRQYDFEKLSGSEFEKFLYRLYTAMGYAVHLNGKAGDQGGDLIAIKDQERLLIQAKCYKDWSVGNKAVQEAVAAKNHYNCNRAAVITTSNFTKQAIELAKTNNVELVPRQLLQKMILNYLHESWN